MQEHARTRYPGAQPFADDALSRRLFYGREQECIALAHQILANRLVVLFARSGLGKTSILNAGVAETLREEGFLPLTVRVNDAAVGPLQSMYRYVETAAARQGVEYVPGDRTSLWHFFKSAQFWRKDTLLTPVLILDQFEELFTLQTERLRAEFLDQLSYLARGVRPREAAPRADEGGGSGAALNDAPPQVKIVLSLREDFLACLEEISDRIPGILDERFRLLPLGRAAASKALEAPAKVEDSSLATRPFEIESQAKEVILDFLERRAAGAAARSAAHVEPFQLQLICQHIEDIARARQRAGAQETVRIGIAEVGGEARLRRILKDFYKRQVMAVPSFLQRRGVRRLCSEFLINPLGRRLRMEETEIRRLTGVKSATLGALVDLRLLRRDQSAEGNYYELSHDSLIVPVLETRRLSFLLRGILLGVVGVISLIIAIPLVMGMLKQLSSKEVTSAEVLAAVFLGVVVWRVVAWALRKLRESREMWRRLRF